jgi:phospholipid/cholesterol/gamma-HCH transport system substrate-binding protein
MTRKRILVGVFVVGGIALFAVGLFIIGSQEQLFAHHYKIYADFTQIDTLQTGAKVRVAGMSAGEVTGIQIPKTPSAPFRIQLKVDQKFRPIIREDSVATIETQGMVGAVYINVAKGTSNSPECPAGGTVRSREPVTMGSLMREAGGVMRTSQTTIKVLGQRADRAIQNIGETAAHADGVILSIRGDVKKITSNAGDIMASVRHGHGAAGKLLMDRTVGSDVSATVANARRASLNLDETTQKLKSLVTQIQQKNLLWNVQKTLQNTQHITAQLNRAVTAFLASKGKAEPTAAELKQTVQGAHQVMSNLADDTEALKTNFFLRGFFNRRGFYNLSELTPSEYASSVFLKRPHMRVWVPASRLFRSSPAGTSELSARGRLALDKAMSSLVPHLPNNPMMIEGYSAAAPPYKAYLSSRQRALEVRQYLQSHFHLKPELVGIMPLGKHPPRRAGKSTWNGVCLVLAIASKRR